MASTYSPTQSYSSTSSTSTTQPGTTSSTATSGASTQSASLTAAQIADFLQEFDISSTDEPAFINGNQLTQAGQALQDYGQSDPADILKAQQTLVAMNYLSPTDATGEFNSTAATAFKTMLSTPNELPQYATALSNPTTPISAELNEQIAAGEKDVNTPVTVDLTPTATLTQAITQAFNQNVGVTPSQQEITNFVNQIIGQETSAQEAPRQQAQAEITEAQSEQTALKNLGPDGLDAFLDAYQKAVNGTTQGPVTGATGIPNPDQGPQTPLITPGATTTRQVQNNPSLGQRAEALIGIVHPTAGTHPVTTTGPSSLLGQPSAPSVPIGAAGSTPTYGGLYALSPTEWKAAQQALGTSTALGKQAANVTSAGQAPEAVQKAAAAALAQSLYDQYGSYSDVAVAMSGGNPSAVSGNASGTKTSRQALAETVANATNTQLTNLQNQVNNQTVTTKTTDPTSTDIDAEAAQAAKESDPVGYYAANAANWGSFLTKALYGTPLAEMQPTTSFAGPVGSSAQTAEAGSTTAATTTAAPAAAAA